MTTIIMVLSLVSFCAGFIDSIAGGGGLLLMPALLFAGIPPQLVLGTNKLASTIGTSFALINFVRSKVVVWQVVATGIGFSLVGSFLGSKTILFFSNETVGKMIVLLLPAVMIATMIPRRKRGSADALSKQSLYVKVPLFCFSIGFYDGFLGPGTGSFLIMAFYLFVGLELVQASATAKVFNLASNASALVVFLLEGKVLLTLGLPLALANVAGNYIGSTLAIKKGASLVRAFLILSFCVLFVSLLWKYYLS
ncbi:TSUP family transporter [Heliobacterium undosum]|uniref:Probable membrane transporter protein n=2 Tax=Heliomicrobium undosum TaxID=121734 RepID=A0A845L0R6_9FIRM|nr:TSUP family transporter [Heliomicrobium undosum]